MLRKNKNLLVALFAVGGLIALGTLPAGYTAAGEEKCETCEQNDDGTDLVCEPISTLGDSSQGMTDCDVTGTCYDTVLGKFCLRSCDGTPGSCIQDLG